MNDTEEQKKKIDTKRCCNTCIYKDNSFYGCSKAAECYNGFSAYCGIGEKNSVK